ncbi:uncharacterized oxidoreductase YjmC-like [Gordionus sp. m RMFG-2023]|uniref:uncharacterized oxidoreductase YjmC-like n=1 Tax=Gordionus sp. m RMFG-2023 TaxID=3053472 RepID=UPI0031FC7818
MKGKSINNALASTCKLVILRRLYSNYFQNSTISIIRNLQDIPTIFKPIKSIRKYSSFRRINNSASNPCRSQFPLYILTDKNINRCPGPYYAVDTTCYYSTHRSSDSFSDSTFLTRKLEDARLDFDNEIMTTAPPAASCEKILVQLGEAKRFAVESMKAVGTQEDHAIALAELLVTADYRGHFSHGLNRLPMYVRDIESGICKSDCEPTILKETVSTAWVDGNNLLGPVVGMFAMNLAIKKAKATGVGWISCKNSNHFGIAGYYTIMAAHEGLIGMAFTNTSPLQVPTRAKKTILGTNPIAMTAPAKGDDYFCLDMATSTAAVGKVEYHDRQGIPIPKCWGVNKDGLETQNPKEVLQGGGLLPLGGMEKTGGYKGSGLAMMVEIFCGILAGSTYGPNIRKWMNTEKVADLGQCFVALNPEMFAPNFVDRMSDLMAINRNLQPIEGEKEVLVAGDPERKHMIKCDKDNGIRYHPNLFDAMTQLGERLKIKNLQKSS